MPERRRRGRPIGGEAELSSKDVDNIIEAAGLVGMHPG